MNIKTADIIKILILLNAKQLTTKEKKHIFVV
jgi:hypothetical protein